MGNPHKFLEEETRLKSLRNILNDAGFQEHLYEDFAEDTFDLLRETAAANDGGASLLQTFNDPHRSMSIITYLKVSSHSFRVRAYGLLIAIAFDERLDPKASRPVPALPPPARQS